MGWLEPADRTLHEQPHECVLPPTATLHRTACPGDRWQCDECGLIYVWSWQKDFGKYQWFLEEVSDHLRRLRE